MRHLSLFKKESSYPKFKSKKKLLQSFYVRYDRLYFRNNNCAYRNPYCTYEGKYWYLSFGIDQNENQVEPNKDLSIGIDLGVKDLAIVNKLEKPIKNINKTKGVKKLKKRLRRLQRQISRKYEANRKENQYIKTQNIFKLEKQIKLLHRKLNNIRNNHIHQATNKIIKLKPYRVVVVKLNLT